ncbi:MAG: hypothetical protein U1F36_20820 [Planctomycetota bacterium]
MSLTGLGATSFLAGLASLMLGLGLLHLLRVRMRRQVVDSLLFFRSAAMRARPRVLGRRLTRLGSFLLCAALLSAAWTAFAEPRGSDAARSRVVLVDRTDVARARTVDGAPAAEAFVAEAHRIARSSALGPRGSVIAVGEATRCALRADEPAALLDERLGSMPVGGPPAALQQALVDVARSLRSGDQIVVVGGDTTPPSAIDGVTVVRAAMPALQAQDAMPADAKEQMPSVFVQDGIPAALGLAIDALGLPRAPLDRATLAVVRAGQTLPDNTAAIVVEDGRETAHGVRATAACPAALSLRDRAGTDGPAFAPSGDEAVWVGDQHDRLALVSASAHRVRVVGNWFDDVSHRDVPLLVDAAVKALTQRSRGRSGAALPARDAVASPALESLGGSDALAPWLLACALLLLCADAFLLGRGRVA